MRTFLYLLWFLLPTFFFGIALWSKLEQLSNKHKRENAGDFFRQGIFVSVCVLLSMLIDQYVLEGIGTTWSPDFIPLGFYQVLLLPLALYLAAMLVGPSKAVTASKSRQRAKVGRR